MGFVVRLLPLLAQLGALHVVPNLTYVEAFAGDRSVSWGMDLLGYEGRSFDTRIDPSHNFLSPIGFLLICMSIMAVHRGGVLWGAPPCSTWVWMSRHSTGRSEATILGNPASDYVRSQNALVTRLVHVLALCNERGVFWIVEQPQSSLMFLHPHMKRFLEKSKVQVHRVSMQMGAFSLDSTKGTTLLGTAPYLPELARTLTSGERAAMGNDRLVTAKTYVDAWGIKRCVGAADLKKTQSYPRSFGCAHGLAYRYNLKHCKEANTPGNSLSNVADIDDGWELDDALDDVFGHEPDKWHSNKTGEDKLQLLGSSEPVYA
jgi:hypothetical protein